MLLVFQTGMVGYPESLTDPSYRSQILTLTYPLIGNYGVPEGEKDSHGLTAELESDKIWASALIVGDYVEEYSHWNAKKSLSQWLKEEGIPGISGKWSFLHAVQTATHRYCCCAYLANRLNFHDEYQLKYVVFYMAGTISSD